MKSFISDMDRTLVIALIATVISFSTLYTPQPMLPLLADYFSVSPSEAGLLMTTVLLPLAFAPVLYGYFLQAIPARLMLLVSIALLAIDQLAFYLASEFWQLLTLRLIQGLLLPAIFTALMTFCASRAATGQVRKVMGLYIGSTIVGGFIGRIAGGFFASSFDWRIAFVAMGLLQLVPLFLLLGVKSDADINFSRLDWKSITRVVSNNSYRLMFAALALVFFVFSGVLNILPFHAQEIDATATPLLISMLYLGYLAGAPASFFSEALAKRIGSDRGGMLWSLGMHALGLVSFLVVAFHGLLVMMFFFSAGFFLIHSSLSGLANQMASEHRGVVNGLYVSIYYFSGALGSWLPGYWYDGLGWSGLIGVFMIILFFCALSIARLQCGSDVQ